MLFRRLAVLLLISLSALAQSGEDSIPTDAQEVVPDTKPAVESSAQFEQTSPPRLKTDEYSPFNDQPATPAEPDPGVEIVRQVREILDADRSAPESAGTEQDPAAQSIFVSTTKAISALCIVIALILAASYVLKRFGGKTPLLAGGAMGQVMGRVHLNSKNALYFVRAAGKVLVVGVSPAGVAPVAEFDAEAFENAEEASPVTSAPAERPTSETFRQQLVAGLREAREPKPDADQDDEEIAALRRDVRRLQQLLQDTSSGSQG